MDDTQKAIVYSFLLPAASDGNGPVAPFKAPRSLVERMFQGTVLEGTAQAVDLDELDEQGVYRRLPVGWQ